MIRNIIFDWSGTLVDDLPAVFKATNHVLAQSGKPEMTMDTFRSEFRLPFSLFYERHTPQVPMPQLEDWFHSHFSQNAGMVHELPHAREFLTFCKSRGLRTFVLSTVHPDYFKAQSEAAKFAEFFEKIYAGVHDKSKKIHDLLHENGLAPEETLFIGDMEHDIDTAHHGGTRSCAVLTGYNTLNQLRAAHPDLIVEHLGELQCLLERQGMSMDPPASLPTPMPVVTVGGLIFNDQGQVLMVQTHKWSNLWGIPGGKTKWGEQSEDALRRELKEETDLDIDRIEFVLVQDCIRSKEFYRDAHFVLLNYTCHCVRNRVVKLNEEAHDHRWLTPDQALGLPLNQPTRTLLLAVMKRTPADTRKTEQCRE
jgi:phosphoglycolate phosphatase